MRTFKLTSRATAILLGAALACGGLAAASAAAKPPVKDGHATSKSPRTARTPGGSRLKFRPSRVAAAQEASRFGALVSGCSGRADMERDDHKWIVLCSNGKTYVVEPPPQAGTPVECSLAGNGPEPACFP
jgi:hypothetical protein